MRLYRFVLSDVKVRKISEKTIGFSENSLKFIFYMANAVILNKLIDHLGLKMYAFEAKIGASNSSVSKAIEAGRQISVEIIQKIIATYPEVNLNWLVFGTEPMLNSGEKGGGLGLPQVITVDHAGNENIIFVPVKAQAGYLNGYGDPTWIKKQSAYRMPNLGNGTYRMFEVKGVSMAPTIRDKDIVVGRYVDNLESVRDNRVYTVVSKNDGVVIKRVLNRLQDRGMFYLKSDTIAHRHEFPTKAIDPTDILEIWESRIKLSPDFSEPTEIYTKVNDLEIEVMEIKKFIMNARLK